MGVLTLNEQVRSAHPPATPAEFGDSDVTVTAVRPKLKLGPLVSGDVVLAQARCSIEGLNVLR